MPLKTTKDVKLDRWIIHTKQPYYRVMRPELDKDTRELMEAKKKGSAELAHDHRAMGLTNKHVAAESLEYELPRAEAMLWAMADENGDFIVEDGQEARELWNMLQKDPEPKAVLDPRSPDFPPPKTESPEKVKAK